jgi:hypothetical protein
VTSPEFTRAHAYVTDRAPDLLAMLGLDGAEIRSSDARERDNARKRQARAERAGVA